MKCDQVFCLNLWYDLKKLFWQDELNLRVRCAFGNVSTNSFSMMLKPFSPLLSSLAWSVVVWDSWEEKRGGTKLLLRKSRYLQRGARRGWTGLTVLEDVWSRVKSGRMGFFLISRTPDQSRWTEQAHICSTLSRARMKNRTGKNILRQGTTLGWPLNWGTAYKSSSGNVRSVTKASKNAEIVTAVL